MPQKHEKRKLKIDQTEYGWTVHGDSGYLTLHVWREDGGQKLQVHFDYANEVRADPETGGWNTRQRRSITPSVVRRAIEVALERGWNPAASTPAMLRFDAAQLGFADEPEPLPPSPTKA